MKRICVVASVVVLCLASLGIGIIVGYFGINGESTSPASVSPPGPNESGGPYEHGAVATDAANCSYIGIRILRMKGSAVDAAIASMLCVGVINMHSVGVAGGGMMLVYMNRTAEVIDFRETAPATASRDMFKGKKDEARYGGRAIAVPGDMYGYYMAWKKYGRLPWKELVQPAIDLAKDGFKVGRPLHETAVELEKRIRRDPGLSEILIGANDTLHQVGDVITNLKYAATLKVIRDHPKSFYKGMLAKNIVRDMRAINGSVTLDDLKSYKAVEREALKTDLGDLTMYLTPPPASGAVLGLVLNILKGYNLTKSDREGTNASALTYHRIAEAFKFAYAWRSRLGDPAFVPNISSITEEMLEPATGEYLRHRIWDNQTHDNQSYYGDFFMKVDHGTSHLSVLAPNGDAVSLTSTINYRFGCMYRSTATGIIYNDQMADFDNPGDANIGGLYPSPSNFPEPGKRPFSSVTPVIFTDKQGNVRFVVGASGGKKIITATSLVIMNKLWFGRDLGPAVTEPRIHSELVPSANVTIEKDKKYRLSDDIQDGLRARGHDISESPYFAVVQGIYKADKKKIYAMSDPRKYGKPAGF